MSCILACAAVLLFPDRSEAGKFSRRTRDRALPNAQWCPLAADEVLEFKADSSSAKIQFVATEREGQRVDNVFVVEKSVYQSRLIEDEDCNRESDPRFVFDPLDGAPLLFLERFDADANGWKLNLASWQPDVGENDTGALQLDESGGGGAIVVSGLQKGRTYVVGSWWYTESGEASFTIYVDTPGRIGCGGSGLQAAADGLAAFED
jgi:hypothetical protein